MPGSASSGSNEGSGSFRHYLPRRWFEPHDSHQLSASACPQEPCPHNWWTNCPATVGDVCGSWPDCHSNSTLLKLIPPPCLSTRLRSPEGTPCVPASQQQHTPTCDGQGRREQTTKEQDTGNLRLPFLGPERCPSDLHPRHLVGQQFPGQLFPRGWTSARLSTLWLIVALGTSSPPQLPKWCRRCQVRSLHHFYGNWSVPASTSSTRGFFDSGLGELHRQLWSDADVEARWAAPQCSNSHALANLELQACGCPRSLNSTNSCRPSGVPKTHGSPAKLLLWDLILCCCLQFVTLVRGETTSIPDASPCCMRVLACLHNSSRNTLCTSTVRSG